MAHWLLKSEPETFGIDHLQAKGVEHWDGVRNYGARNNLMAMKLGDLGFFYHSSCEVPGVAGICEVVREHYPDFTQFDPGSKYFDAKASPSKPRWFMPDVSFVSKFDSVVPLAEIRQTPGLGEMEMIRFNRLSVSGVSEAEWQIICAMAGSPIDPRPTAAAVTQTVGIVLRFREEAAAQFEEMFRAEVLPLWTQFLADGKFIGASLTRVEDGDQQKPGVSDYILHVELAGADAHHEFDEHPRFLEFLPKAQELQPEPPLVWLGTTLFKVGG